MNQIQYLNHSRVIRNNLKIFSTHTNELDIIKANNILSDYHYRDILYYGLTKYPVKSNIKHIHASSIISGYAYYFIYNQYNISILNLRHIILLLLYGLTDNKTIYCIYYIVSEWIKYNGANNIKIDVDIIKVIVSDISFNVINNFCYFFALSDDIMLCDINIYKFIYSPRNILTYLNIKKTFTDKSKYYYNILYKLINRKIFIDDIVLYIFNFI